MLERQAIVNEGVVCLLSDGPTRDRHMGLDVHKTICAAECRTPG